MAGYEYGCMYQATGELQCPSPRTQPGQGGVGPSREIRDRAAWVGTRHPEPENLVVSQQPSVGPSKPRQDAPAYIGTHHPEPENFAAVKKRKR